MQHDHSAHEAVEDHQESDNPRPEQARTAVDDERQAFIPLADKHTRIRSLLEGQNHALEMIAQGSPLGEALEVLVRIIEEHSTDGTLVSILLLDDDGIHLRHGAAPSLPRAYSEAIDGIAIGATVGSCGTAAYLREQVIVSDIATDPLWKDYRELALQHHLRACWSTPIFSSDKQILGTFAMYYHHPHIPSTQDRDLIAMATHSIALDIEWSRMQDERTHLLMQERAARAKAELTQQRLHDMFQQGRYRGAVLLADENRRYALPCPAERTEVG
ncbi:MAG: GAF domain-containing protein [Thermomicrobiales bacterium]